MVAADCRPARSARLPPSGSASMARMRSPRTLGHRRSQRHRDRGLADAALQAEDPDLVGVAGVPADAAMQFEVRRSRRATDRG